MENDETKEQELSESIKRNNIKQKLIACEMYIDFQTRECDKKVKRILKQLISEFDD